MNTEQKTSIEPFFLGPKSENENWVRNQIDSILDHWFQWRKSLFTQDQPAVRGDQIESRAYQEKLQNIAGHLETLNELLKSESPTYSPRYIGHMVSEISLPAILGHFSALLHNPNNTSAEVARVGAVLEKEGIEMLLALVGFDPRSGKGHFTSGGTMANFEAIWRARFRMDHWLSAALFLKEQKDRKFDVFADSLMGWGTFEHLIENHKIDTQILRQYSLAAGNPWRVANLIAKHGPKNFEGPVLLIPGNKHFSWQKGCNLFGFGEEALWSIPLDERGKLDPQALRDLIETAYQKSRPILMVVSVAGTTETGEIDPVHEVQDLLDQLKKDRGWDIWHHIDAAYGGFMCSLTHNQALAKRVATSEQLSALKAIGRSNSVTMDPHKLGYVPYSCGAFLVPDELNYAVSQFKAPYLDRPDLSHHKWSSTIEGSRAASGAAATWLTGKCMPFVESDFATIIADTFQACRDFREQLTQNCKWVRPLPTSETNVFCFSVAESSDSLTVSNKKTLDIFEKIAKSPNFSVSKTVLHTKDYKKLLEAHVKTYSGQIDTEYLTLIRCVFMNPFWCNKEIGNKLRAEFIAEISKFYC